MGQPDTAFVGIDVSKAALDACLLLPGGRVREAAFANDAGGHAALIAWADRHAGGLPAHFCLEATGPYSDPPATALSDAGRLVSVANPRRRPPGSVHPSECEHRNQRAGRGLSRTGEGVDD